MRPITPRNTGSLIPPGAAEELARQDAERRTAREKYAGLGDGERTAIWREGFARSIAYELTLAQKWGAEADIVGNTIVRTIKEKYPPRKPGRFIRWLFQFRNKHGVPIFQYNPAPLGFILNEGGRGVTLEMTRWTPFRLYVAGWVLLLKKGKWSFFRRA